MSLRFISPRLTEIARFEPFTWQKATPPSRVPRSSQPRSQGLFSGFGAGREKALASAGHVPTLHPEILGVIN